MKKILALFSAFYFISNFCYAIEVYETQSSNLISKILTNDFVVVDDLETTGAIGSIGVYTNNSNLWDLDKGLIISTGKVTDYDDGENNSPAFSTAFGTEGDSKLTSLSGYPTYDAASVSVHFTATSNKLSFDWLFGSEEYSEFVGSPYNDSFGVWLTDEAGKSTQIAFDKNKDPITINSAWMHDSSGTELDGDTGKLTTSANLLMNKNYTLTFAIADSSDQILDSTAYISNLKGAGQRDNLTETYGIFLGMRDGDAVRGDIDAKNMFDSFLSTNIIKENNAFYLSDSDVTKDDIENILDSLSFGKNDNFIFYYAGHGNTYGEDGGETTKSPGDEYLKAKDLLSDDYVYSLFDDEAWSTVNKWVILDSCHAGGFWGDSNESGGDLENLDNIGLFAGSKENSNAHSALDGTGIFTNGWLTGFEYTDGFLKADDNKDGFVSFNEWDNWLNSHDWYTPNFHSYVFEREIGDMIPIDELVFDGFFSASSDNFNGTFSPYSFLDPLATTTQLNPVPEPSTFLLLGAGLAGLGFVVRRRKKE